MLEMMISPIMAEEPMKDHLRWMAYSVSVIVILKKQPSVMHCLMCG